MLMAEALTKLTDSLGLPFVFKASWRKANRTSVNSYTGVALETAGRIFSRIKSDVGCKLTTDIHESADVFEDSYYLENIVDIFQIPAMLSRQTDLILRTAEITNCMSIKKSQCASPHEMKHAVAKAHAVNPDCKVALIERGTMLGYNNLVVDMRSLKIMRDENPDCPIIFDGTHSVQLPAGAGNKSTGQREFTPLLCRAAIAAGIDGLFLECHDNPSVALCDGPNMVPLDELRDLLNQLMELQNNVDGQDFGYHTRSF
jgi:2-dehydro-3-deoxyphosphooctonate aldolase (KDO 8-P synthase)